MDEVWSLCSVVTLSCHVDLSSSYTQRLSAATWSPTRPSVMFLTREDGYMDAWDILYQQSAPVLSTKVSDSPLTSIKVSVVNEMCEM